jgi:Na+/proline symporter
VFWGALGIEFFAGVIVFTKLGRGPSPMFIALIIAVVIIIYTIKGGYRAATLADWPRLTLVALGFITLAAIAGWIQATSVSGAVPLFSLHALSGIQPSWAFAAVITFVPVQLAGMDMWQRCVAAGGNVKAIRRGLFLSLPLNLLWLVPAYVGALARSLDLRPTNANYVVLDVLERINPSIGPLSDWVVQPLIYGSLVATMASTCDTILMSLIFTFMYDIYGTFKQVDYTNLSKEENAALVLRSKYWVGILGLSSLFVVFVGLFVANLYDLIVTLFAVQIVLFWPIAFVLLFPRRDLARRRLHAFVGLAAGFGAAVATIALFLAGSSEQSVLNFAPIGAFLVTAILYLILALRSPQRSTD